MDMLYVMQTGLNHNTLGGRNPAKPPGMLKTL